MKAGASPASKFRIYGPLEHYDYDELDQFCTCAICLEWRKRLSVLQDAQKRVEARQPTCKVKGCFMGMKGPCEDCRAGLKAQTYSLATSNRRDLYSECSYHAYEMSQDFPLIGVAFMRWLTTIMDDRKTREDGWWVNKSPYLPIQYWLTAFRRSITHGLKGLLDEDDASVDSLPTQATTTFVIAVRATSGVPVSGSM